MTTSIQPRRRRSLLIILGAVVIVGALAGAAYGFSYLFLRDAPPAAVGQSASTSASTSAAASARGSMAPGQVAGPWSVDTSIGSFGDFTSSFVGYRVTEELVGVGAATAVGRTPDVSGSLTIDGTTLTAVEVTADLSTLQSDDDRRDGQLGRQALQTDMFPTSTFALTDPVELTDAALGGETVQLTAVGELTLHDVTRTVEVPITATLADGVITITGSIEIDFADYGITPPSSMLVLSVEDHGIMEFQLHFTLA